MKLIVGLGNPGKKYENNRHNIGFRQLDYFAKNNSVDIKKSKFKSKFVKINRNNEDIILLKPQTFMNLSGQAVLAFKQYYKVANEDILIVFDDIHISFNRFRLRANGSAGGHNGIKSIINALNTQEFSRLRFGIGKPEDTFSLEHYVLSNFNASEEKIIVDLLAIGEKMILSWLDIGTKATMNLFN